MQPYVTSGLDNHYLFIRPNVISNGTFPCGLRDMVFQWLIGFHVHKHGTSKGLIRFSPAFSFATIVFEIGDVYRSISTISKGNLDDGIEQTPWAKCHNQKVVSKTPKITSPNPMDSDFTGTNLSQPFPLPGYGYY